MRTVAALENEIEWTSLVGLSGFKWDKHIGPRRKRVSVRKKRRRPGCNDEMPQSNVIHRLQHSRQGSCLKTRILKVFRHVKTCKAPCFWGGGVPNESKWAQSEFCPKRSSYMRRHGAGRTNASIEATSFSYMRVDQDEYQAWTRWLISAVPVWSLPLSHEKVKSCLVTIDCKREVS